MTDRRALARFTTVLVAVCGTLALWGASAFVRAQDRVDFARQIAPILEQRCYECHGPKKGRGQLRLHDPRLARKGGVTGSLLMPGKPDDSLIVQRLLGLGGEDQMPLDADPLPAEQIALIRAWIEQGAQWTPPPADTAGGGAAGPVAGSGAAAAGAATAAAAAEAEEPPTHWAYVKPSRPAAPPVSREDWVRNPVDRFVLARLEREQLTPSADASRTALLRRVSLDLTGLPPTLAELDAFLADRRPDAYERVVDRLLASPHYGERWARPWLDLARYADTHGYEKDNRRSIWTYRDWVIDALNADMPFDRFTIEQVAGDMLPDATPAQIVASGFHRNAMTNEEGGVDPEEALYEVLVDRVNTTATVWLGSTVGCAQCHNHKYDPFSQKDFYRLLAFFQNTSYVVKPNGDGTRYEETTLDLATPGQEQQRTAIEAEIARLEGELKAETPALTEAQAAWEESLRQAPAAWTPLTPTRAEATGGVTLTPQPDGSVLASGPNPELTTYTLVAETTLTGITGVRLETLTDERLPKGGPGRDPYGHFRVTGLEVDSEPVVRESPTHEGAAPHGPSMLSPGLVDGTSGASPTRVPVLFSTLKVDEASGGFKSEEVLARDGQIAAGTRGAWAIEAVRDEVRMPRQAVLVAERPFGFASGTRLTMRVKHLDGTLGQGIGRLRLSVTRDAEPARVASLPVRLRRVLATPDAERTPRQRDTLRTQFRVTTPRLQATRDALKARRQALVDLQIPTTLVMKERASFERPSTWLRERGSFTAKGTQVFAGVPAALHPLPESAPINRLGLARWLVDPANPLVARVAVNRLWEQVFGRGLVETSEDFGTQGAAPSHPELLDWLATEFVDQRWSQKAILRLLVTSATYRQEARATPALLERHPYNRLFARGPRFRLDAEALRDVALSASGLLNPALHGPSVFPPQPEGIWNLPYNEDRWTTSTGGDRYRRSLYTFLRRTSPYPTHMTFDASSREYCTVRRVRTNTPLQALAMLNDEAFFEAAQTLARRLLTEPAAGTTPAARAAYGFRLATSRVPTAEEQTRLVALYTTLLPHFRARPDAARGVTGAKKSPVETGPEQAAWTIVANVLLNLDETVTKE